MSQYHNEHVCLPCNCCIKLILQLHALFCVSFSSPDLFTEHLEMFVTIKLISGEVTAGDPLSGREASITDALSKKDRNYLK